MAWYMQYEVAASSVANSMGWPTWAILHVGGNNVVDTKMQKMKRIMKRDFNNLFKTFPNTLIVWSEILPRLTWKFAPPDSEWKCWDKSASGLMNWVSRWSQQTVTERS